MATKTPMSLGTKVRVASFTWVTAWMMLTTTPMTSVVARIGAPTSNETVIRGLGEMHLRAKLSRMAQQYKLELDTKAPQIAYRETITANGEGHCRHKKQSGGAGQFGEVMLRVEPLERGAGLELVDIVKGGAIPSVFMVSVEKGVRQALADGVVGGFPVQDLRVTVYDGKSHSVDSKDIAFFTGDLASKRGHVTGTQPRSGGAAAITGQVPLAELDDYQSRLKSLTGGQGAYSIAFSHYAQVPPGVQQQLAAQHKSERLEED